MTFKDYLTRNKKAVRNTLLAGATLAMAGCASLDSTNFHLPPTRPASLAERINPIDNLIDVPAGVIAGINCADYDLRCTTNYNSKTGLVLERVGTTSLDTVLNIVLWLPKEAYEASTGKKFTEPYMPFTKSVHKPTQLLLAPPSM